MISGLETERNLDDEAKLATPSKKPSKIQEEKSLLPFEAKRAVFTPVVTLNGKVICFIGPNSTH
jgi:hypothetical protein